MEKRDVMISKGRI